MSALWRVAAAVAILAGCASAEPLDRADAPLVWLSRADGCVQCAPCRAPSISEIVAGLEAAGIPVRRAALHHVPVCAACVVCASGRQYAVHVESAHVEALVRAGWSPMREPPVGSEGGRE